MKLGIMISTNDAETAWNAFRFGVTSLKANHAVKVFLINNGVETGEIQSGKYNVKEQVNAFLQNNGQILACGTCLKKRGKQPTKTCPLSTMKDLLELVEESDKTLTFG